MLVSKKNFKNICIGICLVLLSACRGAETSIQENLLTKVTYSQDDALEVVNSLCDKQVVLLGEGVSHGEGTTEVFKSSLVKDLVTHCGFDLLLFEASFYEFARINKILKEGGSVSEEEIAAALGLQWARNAEMQNLIKFTESQLKTGMLRVGGLDDQTGGRGQDFANFEMPNVILSSIDPKFFDDCRKAIHNRIIYNYRANEPYNASQKANLLKCLSHPDVADELPDWLNWKAGMQASLYRSIERDLLSKKDVFSGRGYSMYKNFEFWLESSSDLPKVIIWSSSTHAAKSGEILAVFEEEPNLGARVKRRFGQSAYSLGFSALSGSIMKVRGGTMNLPEAPKNSIEATVFSASSEDTVFLDETDLEDIGNRLGAAAVNKFQERKWSDLFDGIVIFREQKPTSRINSDDKK